MPRATPFRCGLGFHKAAPLARWNDGYYFTTCERCGIDLVRTAFGPWHQPKGYRVVWRRDPPPGWKTASLQRASPGPALAETRRSPGAGLPIDEVLRHMNPDEARYVSRSHEEEMADLVERRNRFWRQEFERIMSEDELSSREDDPTPRARRDAQETRGRATSALRRTAGHDEAAE